jgi:hypothetical protein
MMTPRSTLPIIACLLSILPMSFVEAQTNDALESLTQPQQYETRRESSSNEDLHRNGDARSILPGETLVLGELEGPGMITHFWNTVSTPDPFYGRSLVVRMYWDGPRRHGRLHFPTHLHHLARSRAQLLLEDAVFQKCVGYRDQ